MTLNQETPMPHTSNAVFATDAGLETWLLFVKEFELPDFAAFPLLRSVEGRAAMTDYIAPFFESARQASAGFILDTCTWRASPDWGARLGYDLNELAAINREAVAFIRDAQANFGFDMSVLINGVIGPRGDGYDPATIMTANDAQQYHQFQADVFAGSNVDMISAMTMTNIPEAIGIARAADKANIPCVISFTLETDGRLPTGETLRDAIAEVDRYCAEPPIYYMINCAHPDHFRSTLADGEDWINRIRGLRANASRMSHAELDACEVLDDGDPVEMGLLYSDIARLLPNLSVVGGCCGTDHRHVHEMCASLKGS